MTQPHTARIEQNFRPKLTASDYRAMTPPAIPGPRFQLIEGRLFRLPTPQLSHQTLLGEWMLQLGLLTRDPGRGEIVIAPYDVELNEFNVFQPDLLYVSEARRQILRQPGASGAPDIVVEILSDPTRRRYLKMKLPIYGQEGVREAWVADLDARTLSIYSGNAATPAVFTDNDTLASDAIPGVAIELGPIFARALR